MATATSGTNAQSVAQLIPKIYDEDPDLRYMALNDMNNLLNLPNPTLISVDYNISAKLVDALIHGLKDKNGEVQNMAIKCLGPFVNKAGDNILCPMIDRVSMLQTGDIIDVSIPALALRTIVVSLPRPLPGAARSKQVQESYNAISKAMIPRLVGYTVIPLARKDLPKPPKGMLTVDVENGTDSNAIDVLTEVARCFGSMLDPREVAALTKSLLEALEHERTSSALKKKAVVAVSALAPYFSKDLLGQFISQIVDLLNADHTAKGKRKLYFVVLGSMARVTPKTFGPYLETLAPFVLSALSEEEIENDRVTMEETEERDPEWDELREAALVALESFLYACPESIHRYSDELVAVILRFLKYDPMFSEDDDEEMDEDEPEGFDDDDFEEEAGADDDDDGSWKVRRCAAKLAAAFIASRSNGNSPEHVTLYTTVAPALLSRFKEREENVRIEDIAALTSLIRVTGGSPASPHSPLQVNSTEQGLMGPPTSKKRRRVGSDASMVDGQNSHSPAGMALRPASSSAAMTSLLQLSPDIVRNAANLLKASTLPTKQACIGLLKDLATSLHGQSVDYLDQTVGPVVEAVQTAAANASLSGSTAVGVNYRIEAIHFLSAVAQSHSAQQLLPYLAKIIPALCGASKEKNAKVSSEALGALELFTRTLASARAPSPDDNVKDHIVQIHAAVTDRISANDADVEVRRLAVHAEGLLLGLTAGTALLSSSDRKYGLDLLGSRLLNELTRLASVRALETAALLAKTEQDFPPEWIPTICGELGAQLRKASRSLRGSSLTALKALAVNPASRAQIDSKTIKELLPTLLPILQGKDLHMIGPALTILAVFVDKDAKTVVQKDFIAAFCDLMGNPISGSTLAGLLALVRTIGQHRVGLSLMTTVLRDVSLKASTDLVGKVVGNLLVAGGDSVGVKLEDFVKEATAQIDEKRKCLALSVMGEAALKLGNLSNLQPQQFTQHFPAKSEKVPLAAAVALGRAGSGNITTYMPFILDAMSQPKAPEYLLLHAIREIVQCEGAETAIIPYAASLWDNLVKASQAEDNRAIGSECIGRLAVIDPKTYLPRLQAFLTDKSPITRGMVISALRFTFAEPVNATSLEAHDRNYDDYLSPVIVDMLKTMLSENNLENRRLALTTLNSAAHNKPGLILPHLDDLLPLLMQETIIQKDLIREVQMGPFKHKVDDGLEIRKAAYETLYALLDSAAHLVDISALYDRVVAGLIDDHEIRLLCILMLSKLIAIAPAETKERLDVLVAPFRAVLDNKPKENAVKQEVERSEVESRDVVRLTVTLARVFPDESGAAGVSGQERQVSGGRAWPQYWDWLRKDLQQMVKAVEEENRDRER